jgi:hypothetical protein
MLGVVMSGNYPTSVANRLAGLIRMLSSPNEGEVVAAARAMLRMLKTAGSDIHALADHVANNGNISEAEMQRVLDAGIQIGMRRTEARLNGSGNFRNADGRPDWHEIARYCQLNIARLDAKQHQFVNNMASRTVWHGLTERQQKYLYSLFCQLGGRI